MAKLVAAAAIVDSLTAPSVLLCAQRSYPTELAGKWELPGGKVEPGEDPRHALTRELAEELGVSVRFGPLIPATTAAIDENTRQAWRKVYAHGGVYAQQVDGDYAANRFSNTPDWPLVADLRMRVWACELEPAGARELHSLDGGHRELRWVPWARVSELDWLPADAPILQQVMRILEVRIATMAPTSEGEISPAR